MFATSSKSALRIAVVIFAGVVLLDPGDNLLHLKLPFLLLTLFIWAVRVICGATSPRSPTMCACILLFALILPAIASLISLFGDTLPVGEPLRLQLIKEFSVLLIIPVIVSEDIDLVVPILRWSVIIAALTLLLAGLSVVAPALFAVARGIAVASGSAIFQERSELGLGIGGFYYKTASLLVFPIAYHLHNLLNGPGKLKSAFLTLMFTAAVLCTDSRAIAIGVFLILVYFVTKKLKTSLGWTPALLALVLMVALPAGYFATFFQRDELSNAAKLGHFRSYAALFNDHPTYLLWGQGADTEFYTEGFQDKTTLTELTYLDLIRWFGVPVSLLIMGAVIYPIFTIAKRGNASTSYLVVAYVAYLWEAVSNPLLVCSFGALVVSAMWQATMRNSVERSDAVRRCLCGE